MYGDKGIKMHIVHGNFQITPFDEDMIQPASIDVRLGNTFKLFGKARCLDPLIQPNMVERKCEDDEPLYLYPGSMVLGHTLETIYLSTILAARFEGKSSLGRLGLMTHVTAGFIDPGFSGQLTVELANVNECPIRLWPRMRIGQICIYPVYGGVSEPYGSAKFKSRYQGQTGPVESRAWMKDDV